jgi:hypothetical protein
VRPKPKPRRTTAATITPTIHTSLDRRYP